MPWIASVGGASMPPWLEEAYRNLAQKSYETSQHPYASYMKPRLAEMTPDIRRAQELGRQTGSYEPLLREATQNIRSGAADFPSEYQRYMNPHMESVLNNLQNRAHRAFTENFLPALQSRFIAAGQSGGRREQELATRSARDVQEALLAQQNEALSQGYEQAGRFHQSDKARQLAAAEALSGIGRQQQAGRLGDIATLQELGQQQQGQEQQGLNLGYQDFLRQQYHPQEQIAQHAATISGLPSPTQTFQSNYTSPQAQPQVNTLGGIGALATSLYGARQLNKKRGGPIKKKESSFRRIYK